MTATSQAKPRGPFAKLLRSVGKRIRRIREGGDERRFLNGANGIIHIGANTGQEAATYARLGVPVVWIEPLEDVFLALEARVAGFQNQTAIQALVSNADGNEVDFHVAGESSSMFAFADHKKLWPSIDATGVVKLTTTRLDSLMARHGLATPPFDSLVIDTQGAELLVLQGAGARLAGIRRVVAEAADFEAYRGATNVDELVAFMAREGFRLRHRAPMAGATGIGTYYNLFFER
jgi:FkbM family methyltransferase